MHLSKQTDGMEMFIIEENLIKEDYEGDPQLFGLTK